jgi:hypothetical protein
MTRTFLTVALALFSSTSSAVEKPRVQLFWSDYELLANKLSAGARKALEREVRSIFADAGIDLHFIVGSPEDHGNRDVRAIRIVLMPRSGEGWAMGSEAMGAILEKNASAKTVYIFLPVVERTLGYSVDGKMLHDGRKSMALARALARVLAHETAHAIDSTIPHGPDGSVMTANLTSTLLLSERLRFHESTVEVLLRSLVVPKGSAKLP